MESAAILDALDELAGVEQALVARDGRDRRTTLRVCALAMGLADKAVSLLYERVLRPGEGRSTIWVDRCKTQIRAVLDVLEADRISGSGDFWLGRFGHADVAVACALRFLSEAHPALFAPASCPALRAASARCEAMRAFRPSSSPCTLRFDRRPTGSEWLSRAVPPTGVQCRDTSTDASTC